MDYEPFNDEGRAKAREDQQKRSENERINELADLLFVMGDPAGRRFIHRQLASSGVWHQSYVQGDTHQTAFNEGVRSRGLKLLADITEIASAQYALMIEENRNAA